MHLIKAYLGSSWPSARLSVVCLSPCGGATVTSYKDVLHFIQKTPIVYAVLLLTTLWSIGGGIINVLISVYAYQVFDAGKMGIGLLYGAIGLGFIVGGMIAGRLQRYPYEAASVGLAVEGFAFLLTSFSPTIYVTRRMFRYVILNRGRPLHLENGKSESSKKPRSRGRAWHRNICGLELHRIELDRATDRLRKACVGQWFSLNQELYLFGPRALRQ